jgi:HlyD family secretion protein
MRAWTVTGALCLTVVAAGCRGEAAPDAYGNVEATEVAVSSEVGGRLITFTVEEGQTLTAGVTVGTVDPTALGLQRDQASAQRGAAASRADEIDSQVRALLAQRDALQSQRDAAAAQRRALQSQLETARRQHERMRRLFAQQAATAQQLDQAERDDRVLTEQITAQEEQVQAYERQIAAQTAQVAAAQQQQRTANAQIEVADAQVDQLDDRIRRATVTNPAAGTVLTTYARAGEIVQAGQPLYTIADLGVVDVRAYITEPQLALVTLGQQARINLDVADGPRRSMNGTVSWIASRAEFTPTPIQTRDERADLVYAVKIRVPNENGVLKIGMPVDVDFVR